jgi:hypothetical protein
LFNKLRIAAMEEQKGEQEKYPRCAIILISIVLTAIVYALLARYGYDLGSKKVIRCGGCGV